MRIAQLIKIAQDFEWYYENGYITERDGNACIREGDNFLVTASGVPKHELGMQTHVVVDQNCKIIETPVEGNTPSIEAQAHIAALLSNGGDAKASVHVHSPNTVALFSLFQNDQVLLNQLEMSLNTDWPELFRYTYVGITVPFLKPGSKELHDAIANSFDGSVYSCGIVVMQRHGVIATGVSLEHCREHIHRLEHVCSILLKILNASGGNIREIL